MNQVDELKTGTAGGGPNSGEPEHQKVTFLPDQQAKVQELIDEAYRKAWQKAKGARPGGEEMERLKSEVERLKEEKKNAVLLRALSRHNVIDAEEVAELLRGRVREDSEGNFVVAGETGAARITSAGVPMSVEDYVEAWLSERPHHLRAAGGPGAGSRGARFGASPGHLRHNYSDPSSWREMPREELDRLLKEGINIQGSAGQIYRFKDVKNPFLEARRRKFGGQERGA